MVAGYLKLAFRHLSRNRGMAGLTLFGLSIGVASFSLIALWVHDEDGFSCLRELSRWPLPSSPRAFTP